MRRSLAAMLVAVAVLPYGTATAGADTATAAKWAIQSTPNPAGATVSDLSGVSCTSVSACIATGNYAGSLSTPEHTLADRWTAARWMIEPTRHPAGATGSGLSDVSCPAVNACIAVGGYSKANGTGLAFAESWNGARWSLQTTAKPAVTELLGVSCTSANACTAVGSTANSAGTTLALAERWNGSNWSIQTTEKPAGAMFSRFYGVSCTSPPACVAVGYYATSAGVARTFAERRNGSGWSLQKTPIPAGATHSDLLAVSCTSRSACTAVGSYGNKAGAEVTLCETWNGSKWSIAMSPNPAGDVQSDLGGVSCSTASVCLAVGYYTLSNTGPTVAFAERRHGAAWSLQTVPNYSDATAGALHGVSCTSATACTAVGYYETSAGVFTLAERYS
jgi:hypothetical protein